MSFLATVSQSQRVWTHVASMLTRHLVGATETQRFCVPEVPLELPSGGTLPRPGRRLQTTGILGSFSGGRQGHHLWALSLCSRPPRSPGLRLKVRRTRKGLDRRAPWLRTASVVRALPPPSPPPPLSSPPSFLSLSSFLSPSLLPPPIFCPSHKHTRFHVASARHQTPVSPAPGNWACQEVPPCSPVRQEGAGSQGSNGDLQGDLLRRPPHP